MRGNETGDLPRACVVATARAVTPRVRLFTFHTRLTAHPGQFVMAWLPGIDEKPFSVMDVDPLTLAVSRVGRYTEALLALGAGDRLWVRGPFGRGFALTGRRLILVGGGYGAAPLAFLARRALEDGCQVAVVLGARTADDLLLPEHFRALGCQVFTCTDDGSDGHCMLADAALEWALDRVPCDEVCACGPEPMLDAIEAVARRRGLPAQLSREAYMRCGIGVCGSCTCGDQLVCRDGPVFRMVP